MKTQNMKRQHHQFPSFSFLLKRVVMTHDTIMELELRSHFVYNVPNPQLGTKTSSIYFHSFLLNTIIYAVINSPNLPIHITIVSVTKKEKVAIDYIWYYNLIIL